ncbi:putative regulator of septum formation [Propionicimonas paludicola]|uniref:Putative regulator of septum formation n=1 Tax=Propionicimonas paludicola TaxID=185243 RepID=A0A2A9CVQ3_9ACTN|nr:septum formation family protein [Propionicimonas paludicola]PFG18231.1 putative regulator of septum formation [Propionicimonas paludicola]
MTAGVLKAFAAGALLTVLAGCTSAPAPVPSPSPTVSSSTSALAKLGPGDCLGALDDGSFDLAKVASTSCTGPHHWEVSEVVPLTGEDYPGAIDLKQQADADCGTAFADYVGAEPGYSRYLPSYLVPDETAWSDPSSRRAVCLAGSATEELRASIKGDTQLFARIGECTQSNGAATAPKVVPCTRPHEYEAYAEKQWTGKAAPTKAESEKLYTEVCVKEFTKFVGIDVGRSRYEIAAFVAPADAWDKIADHRLVCTVGTAGGTLTGSVKGSKE